MLRATSLNAALPLGSSKGHAETATAPHPGIVESEPRPKGEFEGWEVGEDDLT